jgi:hypothetical protein
MAKTLPSPSSDNTFDTPFEVNVKERYEALALR